MYLYTECLKLHSYIVVAVIFPLPMDFVISLEYFLRQNYRNISIQRFINK